MILIWILGRMADIIKMWLYVVAFAIVLVVWKFSAGILVARVSSGSRHTVVMKKDGEELEKGWGVVDMKTKKASKTLKTPFQ